AVRAWQGLIQGSSTRPAGAAATKKGEPVGWPTGPAHGSCREAADGRRPNPGAVPRSGLGSGSRLLLGGLANQALDGGRGLRAHALPVAQAVLGDAQGLFAALGGRVVEAQALDEAAIAAGALVGHDDVEERTALGAAARESNHDHDESFGWLRPGKSSPAAAAF